MKPKEIIEQKDIMELKEKKGGVYCPSEGRPIPFVRCHFMGSHEGQEYHFYVYQHVITRNWFVINRVFDDELGTVRWSHTLWNGFKKAQRAEEGIIRVPLKIVEEMERGIRVDPHRT